MVIVATVATAVSVTALLFLTGLAGGFQQIPGVPVTPPDPGAPQTILILGSDKREGTPGDPGRSDTTLLLRVDAAGGNLSLLSLPRDLRVDIAGRHYGRDKLNAAYTYGGTPKTVATVRNLTGLEINHVVNVDFQGFADAVDAIGCVYVDVDHQYQHSNDGLPGDETYAEIHVNSGYQRLCGEKALQYVRFRHTDTDLVRSARQQDFLSNARHQVPIGDALPLFGDGTGSDLLEILTDYTSSDIETPAQVISVLKAFAGVRDVPVREVHFEGTDEVIGGISYVTASREQVKGAVNAFLGASAEGSASGGRNGRGDPIQHGTTSQKPDGTAPRGHGGGGDVIPTEDVAGAVGIDKFAAFGRTSSRRLDFPVFVPTVVAPGSAYDPGSRQYEI